ncbi:MAG TPA: tlde1 domain-containing protein [Gemmataceae bacterium]|nr:tlde1 domain-containing protein [Gemmataceae bacterium]
MRLFALLTGAVAFFSVGAVAPSQAARDDGQNDKPRYVYEQTTGNLYLVAGADRTLLGTGYSGTGDGRNNPDLQGTRNVGPIPQGLWRIGDAHDSQKTGKLVMDLTPVGHDALGRSDFQMHGDNAKTHDASHGCIVMDRSVREKIASGEVRELEVVHGPDAKKEGDR